jgi:hypothetical protein
MMILAFATVAFGLICTINFLIEMIEDISLLRFKGGNVALASPSDVVASATYLAGSVSATVTGLWAISQATW